MKTKKLSIKYTRSVCYNWTMIKRNLQPAAHPKAVVQQMEGDHLPGRSTLVVFRARAFYFKTELFSSLLGAKLAHETHACWDHDLLSTQNNCSHCSNLLFFVYFSDLP